MTSTYRQCDERAKGITALDPCNLVGAIVWETMSSACLYHRHSVSKVPFEISAYPAHCSVYNGSIQTRKT